MTSMDDQTSMNVIGRQAKSAARCLRSASTDSKNKALLYAASAFRTQMDKILAANAKDRAAAEQKLLAAALKDRLALDVTRVESMAQGLEQIAALADPVGAIDHMQYRPSGIQVGHMRVPIGVIGIIYESRPNVTADAAALCLKSGNAAILRGGSEAIHSNRVIAKIFQQAIKQAGLPSDAVQLLQKTDRALVGAMLACADCIDVIIPRGGKSLIERVSRDSRIPVIKHLDGICHVYIDADADPEKAVRIAVNSKTHRYGVCNAMETLLVHQDLVNTLLPEICSEMLAKGVALRGCERACAHVASMTLASEEDWATEYLAPILSICVVDDVNAAIAHIERWGSAHTDTIVTEHHGRGQQFLREVDSSSVMWNASTRFADGFEYGLGAEIGISTDRLHVRGPVGLEGLTTQKWIVMGNGEIR
ncbi:MAG: glutamate-5-semialdehyde dehydrogenase [Mariprofundaceae bacterium]|nr:glutamate-5-semialdehyde dehydrogenase [Mariprofundaceae bacterium]